MPLGPVDSLVCVRRRAKRSTGWIVAGVGGAGGLVMVLAARNASDLNDQNTFTGLGIGTIIIGALIGLPLGLSSDVAQVKPARSQDKGVADARGRWRDDTRIHGLSWSTTF